ncbi:DUF3077 domain-containing protein [Pseudomonas capeferrum]|uniref:DUF3077 domain-containing protein n=1 Tax=Pseudomonas capeferrum TaxID=1495066 RepID=UPI0015E48878|nr:DUF3077 domain-containing protein [Pseudomonas capeferrum]MBA1201523.1 DUF3077 domain-containing protein [Pseudomonas capeferrum]
MSDEAKTCTMTGVETFSTLFQIRPDVPFDHAFDELSVLLGCIRHLTLKAEMEGDRLAGSAARILSAFAKALVNDMEQGMKRRF